MNRDVNLIDVIEAISEKSGQEPRQPRSNRGPHHQSLSWTERCEFGQVSKIGEIVRCAHDVTPRGEEPDGVGRLRSRGRHHDDIAASDVFVPDERNM